jgi:hypothetical protein
MQKSLSLYIYILLVLMSVFTFMYFNKKLSFESERSAKVIAKMKKEVESSKTKVIEANYFSLENNENAQNYFNPANTKENIQMEIFIPRVTEKLLDFNADREGNRYVGQDKMGENKFVINKVKLLNQRWIIADFSNGEYWGEALIKYFVNDDETISFETFQSLLHKAP